MQHKAAQGQYHWEGRDPNEWPTDPGDFEVLPAAALDLLLVADFLDI